MYCPMRTLSIRRYGQGALRQQKPGDHHEIRKAGRSIPAIQNVKYIIAACGTVSSVAGDLGGCFAVPFTGVVAPTAQAAANATRTGKSV